MIRYNECWSDMEHMYNDIIGGGSNGSFRGSPGPDSDIYGNFVSHCWDDGLEVEGGSRNVRVWDNYITQCMMMIGNAADSIGPLYIWRNVCARSQWQPDASGGYFLKMGFAGGEQWMTGHMYIFHNTIFQSDEWLPTGALGGNRIVKHTVSRNNILHVRSPQNHSISNNKRNIDNDYDYDLFNGQIPTGQETHGVRGEPIYADRCRSGSGDQDRPFPVGARQSRRECRAGDPQLQRRLHRQSARHRRPPTRRAPDPIRRRSQSAIADLVSFSWAASEQAWSDN